MTRDPARAWLRFARSHKRGNRVAVESRFAHRSRPCPPHQVVNFELRSRLNHPRWCCRGVYARCVCRGARARAPGITMSLTSFRKQFVDIADACALAHAIVDSMREPILVLDKDLRVIAASRSFYSTFKVDPNDTQGKLLYDLGD